MGASTHRYTATCDWEGSTARGYEAYDRTHRATAAPADATLRLSADPAFRGDPSSLNPEQLFVLAASSCQLLSFLAVAATARIDVVSYHDDAEGQMPEEDPPTRITRVTLRPVITVRGDPTDQRLGDDRLRHLCEVAHRECYIANSIRAEIIVEPTFARASGPT